MSRTRSRTLAVHQISVTDRRGGSAFVAWNLHRAYLARGLDARMFVGRKFTDDDRVARLPNDELRSRWSLRLQSAARAVAGRWGTHRGAWRVVAALELLADRQRFSRVHRGWEDFDHPGVWTLLQPSARRPDVYHCHNLQGDYFDLRAIPRMSAVAPVVLTMHDSWLLSGHCSHPLGCERWLTGCGSCPDLGIYPAIRRDATGFNWQRKRALLRGARLHLCTPSRWLMDKVERVLEGPGVAERRVIANGVDLDNFAPGDRQRARARLGLPADAAIVASNSTPRNAFKDYATLRRAFERLAHAPPVDSPLVLLVVGTSGATQRTGRTEIRFTGRIEDSRALGDYYRAADLYAHAALEDTFPNSVIEALACATPVVASAVGGIPEQVSDAGRHTRAGPATGLLVPARDDEAMAAAIRRLLGDDTLRAALSAGARRDACARFGLNAQAERHIEWYAEISERWRSAAVA